LEFGFVIINTLSELKEYQEMDFEMHEASEDIDA